MACRFVRPLAPRGGLALLLWLVPAVLLVAQETPIPVPDEASLEEARQLARDVYGKEYQDAKTPEQLQALAGKLLREAEQGGNDPAGRFVLLKLAADVAARAADGRTALVAIDRITETYDADGVAMKMELLSELADGARSKAQQRAIALRTLPVVAEAVREDQFESAVRLGRIALAAAQKARDGALVKKIVPVNKQVQQAQREYAKVEVARQTLDTSPTDPAANLLVGRYLALVKGDWEAGVSMLALGSDPELEAVATADIQQPTSAQAQVELADRWWQLAEQADETERASLQIRAGHWYRRAIPGLSGLVKAKVDKRLENVPDHVASSLAVPTPWVRFVNVNSGLCLSLRGTSTAVGGRICQNALEKSARERQWEIVPLDREWCVILNRHSNQSLTVPGASKTPGDTLVQSPLDPTAAEYHWRLVPTAPGSFGILNRNSGQAVAVAHGSKNVGGSICQWPFSKVWAQHQWRIEPVVD